MSTCWKAAIKSKENIRDFYKPRYNREDFSVTFYHEIIEISEAGDLGYVIGVYESQVTDSKGTLINEDKGKYMNIWNKQNDNSWKCSADIFNTDILK